MENNLNRSARLSWERLNQKVRRHLRFSARDGELVDESTSRCPANAYEGDNDN
jgi:hypothetical protein